jgi:hypothetical protein
MLTPAQLLILKAAILAETDAGFVAARAVGNIGIMAAFLNAPSAVTVWKSYTDGDALRNAVIWANMTPAQTPDGTTIWTNRNLAAQSKQISLQTLVQGQSRIASGLPNIRGGLQDCLTALPTSVTGTNQGAGWTTVQALMQRVATVGEALFIDTATGAAPWDLVWEGTLSNNNLQDALNAA